MEQTSPEAGGGVNPTGWYSAGQRPCIGGKGSELKQAQGWGFAKEFDASQPLCS